MVQEPGGGVGERGGDVVVGAVADLAALLGEQVGERVLGLAAGEVAGRGLPPARWAGASRGASPPGVRPGTRVRAYQTGPPRRSISFRWPVTRPG